MQAFAAASEATPETVALDDRLTETQLTELNLVYQGVAPDSLKFLYSYLPKRIKPISMAVQPRRAVSRSRPFPKLEPFHQQIRDRMLIRARVRWLRSGQSGDGANFENL